MSEKEIKIGDETVVLPTEATLKLYQDLSFQNLFYYL